jgi:Fur family transcriptional regulator, peroxide stress response regulator
MLDTYVKLLKDNAIKVTPQRLEILRYLDQHHTHPTVDEIYSALKTKNPALSKTTVYNSIETLKKHKLIQSLTISGSETRYDLTGRLHHHFLCQCCGAIIDINISCPNINTIIQNGHRVDEVHGYFKGICRDCIQKGRTTDG